VQFIIALSRSAVIIRHWFEIDLEDASMEHGARIELRELTAHSRRGTESAAQLITLDRALWRADLFDRLADAPGTFGAAHYHPMFADNEPCPRVFDPSLTDSPWDWLRDQLSRAGAAADGSAWAIDPEDAQELSTLAAEVVDLARQSGPDRCRSAAECCALTRDAREAVQEMMERVRQPELIDVGWVAPWRETA
jgi:hypothetical protein